MATKPTGSRAGKRQKQLTPDLLERFYGLLRGLPKAEGGLAHRAWAKHGGLPIEDDFLVPRRNMLRFHLRRIDRDGGDLEGTFQDLAALKSRLWWWYVRGGHEDPRLGFQPDLWRDEYAQRDLVVKFLKGELVTMRVNPLLRDLDPAEFGAEFGPRNWVGPLERYLKEDPRATMQPTARLRRETAGTPKLPLRREGRRMLGRRGIRHGYRDALLMAVGLIPFDPTLAASYENDSD